MSNLVSTLSEHTRLGLTALQLAPVSGHKPRQARRAEEWGLSLAAGSSMDRETQGDPMSRSTSAAKWRSACASFALLLAAISFSVSAPAQTLPTAQQVASQINLGWNLGNTLEAICSETAWGNPATNQALINSVKAAGFNAIRIPISWNCHITDGSTNIPADWMTRVKQVVDMAIGQNMYVIINIHWDNGWLQDHVTDAEAPAINARQNALWTQIATTFRTYDQRLLFAGTNEVHADFGTPTAEHNPVQQSYNQTFVNAVRATGGNNASRSLVVQTYNTNIQHGLNFFNAADRHHREPADGRSALLRPVRLHAESERRLQFLGSAVPGLGRQLQLGL